MDNLINKACDWLWVNTERWLWADYRSKVCGVSIEGLVKYFKRDMERVLWTDVKDELPPKFGFYFKNKLLGESSMSEHVIATDGDTVETDWYDYELDIWASGRNVTHWMPLPEKPKKI